MNEKDIEQGGVAVMPKTDLVGSSGSWLQTAPKAAKLQQKRFFAFDFVYSDFVRYKNALAVCLSYYVLKDSVF